jgi:hypothetical protein
MGILTRKVYFTERRGGAARKHNLSRVNFTRADVTADVTSSEECERMREHK